MSDESVFGDSEPEDAWQADDPIPLQIENLLKRLDVLDQIGSPRGRFGTVLDVIEMRLRPWVARKDTLDPRAQVRVEQLVEDLQFLRDRDQED